MSQTKEQRRAYYLKNKGNILARNKAWRLSNASKYADIQHKKYLRTRERILVKQKNRRETNPEEVKQIQKNYRDARRPLFNFRAKLYKQKDPIGFRKRAAAWATEKYKKDPNFRLRRLVGRGLIKLVARGAKKNQGTIDYLGCTIAECRTYLESQWREGMSWETHGLMGWHIDHIRPLASFDFTDETQIRAALHYTNLQPLWWYENLSKGTKVA